MRFWKEGNFLSGFWGNLGGSESFLLPRMIKIDNKLLKRLLKYDYYKVNFDRDTFETSMRL